MMHATRRYLKEIMAPFSSQRIVPTHVAALAQTDAYRRKRGIVYTAPGAT